MLAKRGSRPRYSTSLPCEAGPAAGLTAGVLEKAPTWENSPRYAVSATGVRGPERYKARYKRRHKAGERQWRAQCTLTAREPSASGVSAAQGA